MEDNELPWSDLVLMDLRSKEAGHYNHHNANYESALDVPRLLAEVKRLRARSEELTAERDLYRGLAEQLYQPGPCSFDHHGGCQEHLWLSLEPGEECPDGRAQRLFAKSKE